MILRILAEASLRMSLVAGFVGVILVALRVRASALRHDAWRAVLGAMLLMPSCSTGLLPYRSRFQPLRGESRFPPTWQPRVRSLPPLPWSILLPSSERLPPDRPRRL